MLRGMKAVIEAGDWYWYTTSNYTFLYINNLRSDLSTICVNFTMSSVQSILGGRVMAYPSIDAIVCSCFFFFLFFFFPFPITKIQMFIITPQSCLLLPHHNHIMIIIFTIPNLACTAIKQHAMCVYSSVCFNPTQIQHISTPWLALKSPHPSLTPYVPSKLLDTITYFLSS